MLCRAFFYLIVSHACNICLVKLLLSQFPSQILYSLISFEIFGIEILVHYFYSTLFFYSARLDSVSKCMSQVAAILCAGIRITKHSTESDIQICYVYHAQTCPFLLLFFFISTQNCIDL